MIGREALVRELSDGIIRGLDEGGSGSGHWGHKGRKGKRGGSAPGGSDWASKEFRNIKRDLGLAGKGLEYRKKVGMLARLAILPKSVEDPAGVIKPGGKNREGRCYEFSGRMVVDNLGWKLVHGTIFPPVGPFMDTAFAHGWGEKGDLVYDGVFNHFYKKEDYYRAYLPKGLKKYHRAEASKKALKNKHWGPWE